jgi:hypothetical protein
VGDAKEKVLALVRASGSWWWPRDASLPLRLAESVRLVLRAAESSDETPLAALLLRLSFARVRLTAARTAVLDLPRVVCEVKPLRGLRARLAVSGRMFVE